MFIDCPAGIDIGFLNAIAPAREAIIVTTPEITSIRDADRVAGLLEANGVFNVKLLVNRVRADMIKKNDMMSVRDVQEMLGVPLLGAIPEDTNVIISTNRGEPLVLKKKLTLAGIAYENAGAWCCVCGCRCVAPCADAAGRPAQRACDAAGFTTRLSPAQLQMRRTQSASPRSALARHAPCARTDALPRWLPSVVITASRCIGVGVGCIIGMFPLLLGSHDSALIAEAAADAVAAAAASSGR